LELGLVLSLLFLVRLDLALLSLAVGIVATGLLITGKLPFRHWLIKGIYWGFPVFATASIYFLFNLALTSSVTPISGALKSSFPEISFQSSKLRILIYPVFLLFFAVICLLVSRRHQSHYFLLFGVTFMALHLVYTALFMEWGVHLWHFTGYLPFVLLGAACLTEKATDGPIHRFGVFAACGIIVLWAFIGQFHCLWQRADRAFQAQSVKAALWTRENVPAGRVIGMSDCGVFGYFRGGLVVNLDGLINNRNYQEHVAKEGLASYLYSQNIHLIAHHAVPIERLGAEVPYWRYSRPSRLFEQLADPFIDLRRTAIIYGGPEFHDGRGPRRFVIWRISHTMNQREAPLR
jgi:hypothetical protein